MKKAQCKKGLDIYDRYLERMDKVQQFFKVAEKVFFFNFKNLMEK